MDAQVHGTVLPELEVSLNPGEKLVAEAGELSWLTQTIELTDLAPGETLRVHPGHVGMFQAQMAFDIALVPGIKIKLFGGDGLFLATLTGPGRVWLQTLPIANLAHALQPYIEPSESSGTSTAGATLGGALNGLLGN